MSITLYEFQGECVDKLGKPEIVSRLIGDEMGLLARKDRRSARNRLATAH